MPYRIENHTTNPWLFGINGIRQKEVVNHRSIDGEVVEVIEKQSYPAITETLRLDGNALRSHEREFIEVTDDQMADLKKQEGFMSLVKARFVSFQKQRSPDEE